MSSVINNSDVTRLKGTAPNESGNDLPYEASTLIASASDGSGKAFAEDLARRGFNMLLVARQEDALGHFAKELRVSDPGSAVARERLEKLRRRGVVRPGRLAKLLEAFFTDVSRWGRGRIMAQETKSMARGSQQTTSQVKESAP